MSKTPIKYYGGKTNMLPHILPLIPEHKIYIEPFCGGAAVFWEKPPCKCEILNDTNGNLMNFYRTAQRVETREALINEVQASLHSEALWRESKEIYLNPDKHTDVMRAWALWYCLCFSFGGAISPGNFGFAGFSGKYGGVNGITDRKKQFKSDIKRLEKVTLLETDALWILNSDAFNKPEVFAYIDPPYYNSDCGHYKGYTEADYIKLLTFLGTEFKGRFLLSSYQSEPLNQAIALYGWETKHITQNLSVNGKSGRTKTEVLTWNYQLNQKTLF